MRSQLVSKALRPVENRYLLMHLASILARKFHGRGRIQQSINDSLAGLADGRYQLNDRTIAGGPAANFKPIPSWMWHPALKPEERLKIAAAVLDGECGHITESAR